MKTEHHNFDLGDIVTVFNRSGGKFIIEGRAAIAKIRTAEDWYMVRFLEGNRNSQARYVDPNGQENPTEYLSLLNAHAGSLNANSQ